MLSKYQLARNVFRFVLLSGLHFQSHAYTTYYISSNAQNDNGPGTGWDTAFKTIPGLNKKLNDGTIQNGDYVQFACDSVFSTALEPLKIKSGVTFGAPGCAKRPVLTGAVPLSAVSLNFAWKLYSGNIYFAELPSSINVNGVNVPIERIHQLIDEASPSSSKRLQRARHPNAGDGSFASKDANGTPNSLYFYIGPNTPIDKKIDGIPYSPRLHLYRSSWKKPLPVSFNASNFVGAEVFVRQYDWLMSRFQITGIDSRQDIVSLGWTDLFGVQSEAPIYQARYDPSTKLGGGYWLENKLWMLDAPGEWYFDASVTPHRLYIWPEDSKPPLPDKILNAVVGEFGITGGMAGRLADQYLTDPNGAGPLTAGDLKPINHVHVNGLEIRDVALDGISVLGQPNAGGDANSIAARQPYMLTDLEIHNVFVKRPGRSGIVVRSLHGPDSGHSPEFQGNIVEDAGHFGVTFSKASYQGTFSTPFFPDSSNIFIHDNKITRSASSGDGIMPSGISATGAGNFVYLNNVDGSGFRGIEFGLKNRVYYNTITNTCLILDDCGAIYGVGNGGYSNRPPTAQDLSNAYMNSDVSDNFILNIPGSSDGRQSPFNQSHGVYFDYLVNTGAIFRNSIRGFSGAGIVLGGSFNVLVQDNTVVADKSGSTGISIDRADNAFGGANTVKNNTVVALESRALAMSHASALPPDSYGSFTHGVATYTGNRYGVRNEKAFYVRTLDTLTKDPLQRVMHFSQWQHLEPEYESANLSSFQADGVSGSLDASVYFRDRMIASPVPLAGGTFEGQDLYKFWSSPNATPLIYETADCRSNPGCLRAFGTTTGWWIGRQHTILASSPLTFGPAGVKRGEIYRVRFAAKTLNSAPQDLAHMIRVQMEGAPGALFQWDPIERFTFVDRNWRDYYVDAVSGADSLTGKLIFDFHSNASILFDNVSVEKLSLPGNGYGPNDFHVVQNPTAVTQLATCPKQPLPAGQTESDYKNLADKTESFVCGQTTVPPFSMRVYVMSK